MTVVTGEQDGIRGAVVEGVAWRRKMTQAVTAGDAKPCQRQCCSGNLLDVTLYQRRYYTGNALAAKMAASRDDNCRIQTEPGSSASGEICRR